MGSHYFAYGSNMSLPRLEARVGAVAVVGWASLTGYRHRFSKRGEDGSGKGNIEIDASGVVHGVIYELGGAQLAALHPYESGYRIIDVEVMARVASRSLRAVTYEALAPTAGLVPTAEYLAHYRSGMREHGLPEEYAAIVLAQAVEGLR